MPRNKNKLFVIILLFAQNSFSQVTDSTKDTRHFSGSISVTYNGISLVLTFTLGRPAAIFLLATGKGKLSFEPDIRIAGHVLSL